MPEHRIALQNGGVAILGSLRLCIRDTPKVICVTAFSQVRHTHEILKG